MQFPSARAIHVLPGSCPDKTNQQVHPPMRDQNFAAHSEHASCCSMDRTHPVLVSCVRETESTAMKEVLTKRFWQDVKKTFDEALEDAPVKADDPGVPAEVHPGNIESAEAPTPPADL